VKVLYVSPHPDDVAFSAAARMASDRAAGRDLTLLTLFAPDDEARAVEDRAFAQLAGARLLAGGFRDAPLRGLRKLRQLFGPLDDEPLVEGVRAKLQSLVAEGHERVVAPLGIGGHVDHQLAYEAARRLRDAEVLFYEDAPYVFMPHQLGRRLDDLGLHRDAHPTTARASLAKEFRVTMRSWRQMPFVRKLAPLDWPMAAGIAARQLRPRRPKQLCALADVLDGEKLPAIACYPSQWRLFFPSLEAWGAALAGYSAKIGGTERAWRIMMRA
jgi:LmbE family N-acetylglucosaminyl deacetylase